MSADSWGDEPVYLSASQIALRDGTAPPSTAGVLVRAQRLANMERELADCSDFVADCDRYATFLAGFDNPCVGPVVPRMMGRYLDELRGRATARGREIRSDLGELRKAAS